MVVNVSYVCVRVLTLFHYFLFSDCVCACVLLLFDGEIKMYIIKGDF